MKTKLEFITDYPIYSDNKIGVIKYQTAPFMEELFVAIAELEEQGVAKPESMVEALRVLADSIEEDIESHRYRK